MSEFLAWLSTPCGTWLSAVALACAAVWLAVWRLARRRGW